ncbi:MAG: D-sedoheptulose 7-phosphate isomerase [Anaeroglobus sp.]|nr:D-sedoheptulose 7-phosphate isomerase [Anaeroglobus sp.]
MATQIQAAELLAGQRLENHFKVVQDMKKVMPEVASAGLRVRTALEKGRKILICGNGGSAADSQHMAAEFVGRFVKERQSLPALALTVDTSLLTAVGNDYGFDCVFSRQVEGLGQEGDVLISISTSGNSANVVKAVKTAKEKGLFVIGMTGENGGILAKESDLCLAVPSQVTARIQEMHIMIIHMICEIAEADI